jgi:hypothetical protein
MLVAPSVTTMRGAKRRPMDDKVELLERLAALWKTGTLTDQEFEAEKEAVLQEIAGTSVERSREDGLSLPKPRLSGERQVILALAAGIVTVAVGSVYALSRPSHIAAGTSGVSAQSARVVSSDQNEPKLAPKLAQALQAGYSLIACKGETKESWRLDGIKPTPESYPDRTDQHPTTMVFRVKWGATPPFDMFNSQSADWVGACERNCIVMGTPDAFTVSKPNQGSAEFPGGIAENMEFHYGGQKATMSISVAENVAEAGADPRLQMVGITHDDKFFSGECRNIQKYSDLPE